MSEVQRLQFTRRFVLGAGLALSGGLLLSCRAPAPNRTLAPNAFLRIDPDGKITFISPKVEMGQGVHTSLAMLLAEELETDLGSITVEDAPPDDALYGDPFFGGYQVTGASRSVRSMFGILREAGATARVMLVSAAAQLWEVDANTCRADSGTVVHGPTGRRLPYGQLAGAAALVPIPKAVELKRPDAFMLIGRSRRRVDAASKVDGSAIFSLDVRLPGLMTATVAASPVHGGKLAGIDERAALAVRGVKRVVRLDDAVAVIGEHFWAARQGLAALRPTWDDGPHAKVNTDSVVAEMAAASTKPGAVARNDSDVEAASRVVTRRVEAIYEVPFLAHATMEPMNCTVHLRQDRCEVWVGTQVPTYAQTAAAQAAGLPLGKVTIHNHPIGGGFGRRLEADFIVQAVRIAQQADGPVKVIWTREEDIQHDFYRPYYLDRLTAGLDAAGAPVSWTHRVVGSSILSRVSPGDVRDGVDPDAVEGAATVLYDIPNLRVEYVRHEPAGIPTGFWRGVGPTHAVFAVESFIDELAFVAGQDPVVYRRALLAGSPRAQSVLDAVAAQAGWGKALGPGKGRGVCVQFAFGTYLAQVAEVSVESSGDVRVTRVTCACDAGVIVNPEGARAQIEGGTLFGLTAALYGEITHERGRVQQTNFHDYRMLRIDEAPAVDVHLMPSTADPGGIGEAATAAIAPAVLNAIFTATGKRLRKLPVNPAALRSA